MFSSTSSQSLVSAFSLLGADGAVQDLLLVDHLGSFDHHFKLWLNCIRHAEGQ